MGLHALPTPLRKVRSLALRFAGRLGSCSRNLRIRVANDGVDVPWSTNIERGVRIKVTDGGLLELADGCSLCANTQIVVQGANLRLGAGTFVGNGCVIVAQQSIRIGQRVLIGEYVSIRDQDHRIDGAGPITDSGFETSPIEIGDDVWIGAKSTVLRGSCIGNGAVVGAHSLVRGDLPDGAVAVGLPARIVRQRAQAHD